ncbi:hypothetical protein FOZ62_012003, partial [Perkinsus olseni]
MNNLPGVAASPCEGDTDDIKSVVVRIDEEPTKDTSRYTLLWKRLLDNIKAMKDTAMNYIGHSNGKSTVISTVKAVVHHPELSNVKWSNRVRTSKYTILSFIPKNLWYQLHLFANVYFLCAAALQMIPAISDSGGRPLLLIPLLFVITVAAVRDIMEDIKRHNNDNYENKRMVHRLRHRCSDVDHNNTGIIHDRGSSMSIETVYWDELRVGDVVRIGIGEQFPADIVLLTCDDPSGMIFVETMNLDGETNLKPKICSPTLQTALQQNTAAASTLEENILNLRAELHYENPNSQLYKFQGQLLCHPAELDDKSRQCSEGGGSSSPPGVVSSSIPLSIDQLLLRGSSLQSCMSGKYAYGVVVYCGMNTRIYRNSAESGTGRNKISKLMQTYNQHVIVLFTLQAMICIVAAFAHGWIYATTTDNSKADDDDTTTTYYWYLYVGPQSVDAGDVLSRGLRVAGSLLLQFTYFVPISLLVTLEIVKYFQGRFVSADGLMQHNGLSAASNSSTLIEELGSVTHVFSDKTGTLTDNLMIFTSAYVMGSGAANSPLLERYQPTDGIPPNPERHVSGQFDARVFERVVLEDGDLHDTPLLFLLGLCLCHSVLIKDSIEPSDDPLKRLGSEFLYDASSPDELALVAGARHLGFEFTARPTPDTIRINLTTPFARKVMLGGYEREDTSIDVELLEVIEFDNDHAASSEEELESVLDALSAGGLRTLVYGVRDLTSDMPFVESWRRSYNGARGLVGDAKERALGQCIQEMECDIDIVGCTGIEDKLQDYVPDTIADLHEAGIKVWVLTGDKIETAINIAYSSRLLDASVLNEVITATTPHGIHKTLDTLSCRMTALLSSATGQPSVGHHQQQQHADRSSLATLEWDDLAEVKLARRGLLSVSSIEMNPNPAMASVLPLSGHGRDEEAEMEPTTSQTDVKPAISSPSLSSWTSVAITISGDSLAVVLKDRPLRKKFFKFALSHCITVIACRVSPKQKAQIVRWSGSYLPANTMLAIGDGAND